MKKWSYYNDNDPFVCEWARNLIKAGLVPDGEVDCRSISEVRADDLDGFLQCHFFCGILGWPLAFSLAGWSEPAWSGSCPCQPLSSAGRQKGHSDDRHLWPAFYELIRQCRPAIVFGEQVASKLGREWFAGVRADLEDLAYACGAADLCIAGVGAPHIRQRLYWVADSDQARWRDFAARSPGPECNRVRAVDLASRAGAWVGAGEPRRFEDGSYRRSGPGLDILVDGFPGRMDAVGAIGNAIGPPLAAEFIKAMMEVSP